MLEYFFPLFHYTMLIRFNAIMQLLYFFIIFASRNKRNDSTIRWDFSGVSDQIDSEPYESAEISTSFSKTRPHRT